MEKKADIFFIDTNDLSRPVEVQNLLENRLHYYQAIQKNKIEASICIIAYNRLEKTKRCIESILKCTKAIEYELILVDNGSTDDTFHYFESINYQNKKVIKITQNLEFNFGVEITMRMFEGRYYILIPNDVIVTENWLSNLLTCLKADKAIGFVTPVSSNISNLQQVDLSFHTLEQMQEQAKHFNQNNPQKWEERLRLINIVTCLKREVIECVGHFDAGFFHDFSEDDYSARVRRAGYKLMLCGDTWVHHDHDFRNMEDKDPVKFQQSLEQGRRNYQEKYHGLDAWDDINNYELGLIDLLGVAKAATERNILGIEIRCGMPILSIRNWLRRQGLLNDGVVSYVFTTQAKYYEDLLFAADGHVVCDRIDYLGEYYPMSSMDYIIMGEPVNLYSKPISLTQTIISLLKKGGKALIKLRNTTDVHTLFHVLGLEQSLDADMPVHLSLEDFSQCLKAIGAKQIRASAESYQVAEQTKAELQQLLKKSGLVKNSEKKLQELCVRDYLFCIEK